MEISSEQRKSWMENPETAEWEAVIGPHYKKPGEPIDIENLFEVAESNCLGDLRERYEGKNAGQIAMNIRNQLRPLWKNGRLVLPPVR